MPEETPKKSDLYCWAVAIIAVIGGWGAFLTIGYFSMFLFNPTVGLIRDIETEPVLIVALGGVVVILLVVGVLVSLLGPPIFFLHSMCQKHCNRKENLCQQKKRRKRIKP